MLAHAQARKITASAQPAHTNRPLPACWQGLHLESAAVIAARCAPENHSLLASAAPAKPAKAAIAAVWMVLRLVAVMAARSAVRAHAS